MSTVRRAANVTVCKLADLAPTCPSLLAAICENPEQLMDENEILGRAMWPTEADKWSYSGIGRAILAGSIDDSA